MRSSLHPLLFAAVYRVADLLAFVLRFSPATRAGLLVAAPRIAQGVIAGLGDFYTWRFARRVYGEWSRKTWAVLALTVASPWQWFCSTRTFSNCLETTMTIVALDLWPWQWSVSQDERAVRKSGRRTDVMTRIRLCLGLAALACILRPTNVLIWATLASLVLYRNGWEVQTTLVREAVICGSAVLAVSAPVDRLFYGAWTFPPVQFLYFNIAQSLAIFYGANDFHYYLSQGLPLLLTTALPFTLYGLYRTLQQQRGSAPRWQTVQSQLALVCVVMPLVLSIISHKEVRFIYPLLPCLHLLSAQPLVDFFDPCISRTGSLQTPRKLPLTFILIANAVIALYTTVHHASGTINIMDYLRAQHEQHVPSTSPPGTGITVGFLMPCHSTPWRSHLVHPTIEAWALTCEPPIDFTAAEKATYLDEADQFYADPSAFLKSHMTRSIPRKPSYRFSSPSSSKRKDKDVHPWPDYLVFFDQLDQTLSTSAQLRSAPYAECHRTFNTAWHDDWRRQGDVVVWCLDAQEQASWRAELARRRDSPVALVSGWLLRVGKAAAAYAGTGISAAWRVARASVVRLVAWVRDNVSCRWPGWKKTKSTSSSFWSSRKSTWSWPWKQQKQSWSSWPFATQKSAKKNPRAERDLWS